MTDNGGGYVFHAATNLLQPARSSSESQQQLERQLPPVTTEDKASAAADAPQPPHHKPATNNAASEVDAPPRAQVSAPCKVALVVSDTGGNAHVSVCISARRSYEAPPPSIAKAFLARAARLSAHPSEDSKATPVATAAATASNHTAVPHITSTAQAPGSKLEPKTAQSGGDGVCADASHALQRFTSDLVPYYLCQYELQGMAITARPAPRDRPRGGADPSLAMVKGLAELAVPLMRRTRPFLQDVEDADVAVEMRPMAQVHAVHCVATLLYLTRMSDYAAGC